MSYVPYVIEKNEQGERSYDIFSKLLSDRIIFLGEEVSDASAELIIAQLLYLEAEDPERDIQLYINSPGRPALPYMTPCSLSNVMCARCASVWRQASVPSFLPGGRRESGWRCPMPRS